MNAWRVGKDLMKHHYVVKKIFIVAEIWKILQILITNMQKVYL